MDPNFAWPYNGETLLHVQSRHDDDTYLAQAYILIKAGADVNAQALSGLDDEPIMDNEHFVEYGKETPLHFAARLGNLRMVRLLLDHGANPSLKTVSRMRHPKQFSRNGQMKSHHWSGRYANSRELRFNPMKERHLTTWHCARATKKLPTHSAVLTSEARFMEVRMASVVAQTYLTPKEYLAFERKATTKHEYLKGQIVAMSGASF